MIDAFRRPFATLLVLAVVSLTTPEVRAQDPYSGFIAPSPPLTAAEQLQKFHLPPGFQIELVAAEPDVPKPVNLAFDARGSLLVTCSVEYPFPARVGGVARDAIKILHDTDQDGHYDDVTTFAGGLNLPVGVTAQPGGLLAFNIANVDRFLDTDGDGHVDEQRVAYGPFESTDTHGLPNAFTWWIDGWIYACQGQTNKSTVAGSDGFAVTMDGGTTFRMKPDGTRIETYAFGQVNPFGLCFDPLGNLYTADSNSRPGSLLLRGAWYPTLGSPHDGMGFGPPIMAHSHASTGIAGIAYYAADNFPADYRDTVFIGNPVTGRINHDRIEFHGATVRAVEQPDFLTCDDPWFRPVDIQLGPDGALYVADFYNRIIAHTLVPLDHAQRDRHRGRIWRISYKDPSTRRRLPDLESATRDELFRYLGHPNLTLRVQATHQLVQRLGRRAVGPLQQMIESRATPLQRAHGLWALERLQSLDGRLIRRLAKDPARLVRVHLLRALAERPRWESEGCDLRKLVSDALTDPDALVRREAAEALGRHPSTHGIRPLLALWNRTSPEDAMLVHTIRLALRDHLAACDNVVVVSRRWVRGENERRRLADVSLGLRRADAAAFLHAHLRSEESDPQRLREFLHHVARYAEAAELPEVYATARTYQDKRHTVQATVLRALYRASQARNVSLPVDITDWGQRLAAQLLASQKERFVFDGLDLAWDLQLKQRSPQIMSLARDASVDSAIRSLAIDVLGAVLGVRAIDLLDTLANDPREALDIRSKAAAALGNIDSVRAREALAQRLVGAPSEMALAIARGLTHDRGGAEVLLNGIAQGHADARLLRDAVVDQHLRSLKMKDLDQRLQSLLVGLPSLDEQLRSLVQDRRIGFSMAKKDIQHGARVFQQHCRVCHQLGDDGAHVGPALDGIGLRGVDRLLEDTLIPSQNVAQSHRSSVLVMSNGRIVTGLVLREEDRTVVVADAEGKEQHLAAEDIEDRRLSRLSPMPEDVAKKLPDADFYHLIAFLLGQRQVK